MKRITFHSALLLCLLCLLPCVAWGAAEDHYVTQSGAGNEDGTTIGDAWAVAAFNDSGNWDLNANTANDVIGPGDTVYFSGTITSQIIPAGNGTSGNPIILDGYKAGDCDPINSECTDSALVQMTRNSSESNRGMMIENKDYITVQDFRFKEVQTGIFIRGGASTGESDFIIIKRCYVYNAWAVGIELGKYFNNANGNNNCTIGGALGDGNYLLDTMNGGENSRHLGLYEATNAVISYNKVDTTFGDSRPSYSSNCIGMNNCNKVLVEYNTLSNAVGGAGVAIKEYSNSDIVVRFNHVLSNNGNEGLGISVALSDRVYVYGNNVNNNSISGIRAHRSADLIYFWSNLVYRNAIRGITCYRNEVGHVGDVNIFNNTISGNGASASDWTHSGLYIENVLAGKTVNTKNNIFDNNNSAGSYEHQISTSTTARVTFEHSRYFITGQSDTYNIVRLISDYKTLAQMQVLGHEDGAPAGTYGAPGFEDAENDNHRLAEGSDCIVTGKNLKDEYSFETFYITGGDGIAIEINDGIFAEGLDPVNTNWEDTPPTVKAVKRAVAGNWDKGAWVYTAGVARPNSTIDTPILANRTIEVGGTVTFAGTASGGAGATYTHSWEEDGSAITGTVNGATVEDPGLKTYNTAGSYAITYTTTDTDSVTDLSPATITITVTQAAGDIKFWWRVEGTNPDAALDYPADLANATGIGGQEAINTDAVKIGTNGLDCPSPNDYYYFPVSSRNLISDEEGRIGFWFKPNTWVENNTILFVVEDADDNFEIKLDAVEGQVNQRWEDNAAVKVWADVATGMSTGNYYFFEFAWQTSSNYRQIWVKGVSKGTDSTAIGSFDSGPDGTSGLRVGSTGDAGGDHYMDNIMISASKNTDLYSLRDQPSYTSYPPPTMSSITCVTNCTGYWKEGESVGPWDVNWIEAMDQSGAARVLTFETGGTDATSAITSPQPDGYGDGTVQFRFDAFTVAAGYTSADLAVKAAGLSGTWTATDDSAAADMTIPANANLDDLYNIVIDTTAPTVTLVKGYDNPDCTTCTADGTVTAVGTTVRFYIQASENIGAVYAAGGFPRVKVAAHPLNTTYANFESWTDDIIKFPFVTTAGMRAADLDYVATTSFEAGDAIIEDLAGNAMSVFTLAEPAAPNSLGANSAIVLAVPGMFTMGPAATQDYATYAAFSAATDDFPGDRLFINGPTETVTAQTAGTSSLPIIFMVYGLTGDFDVNNKDYVIIQGIENISGSITNTGTGYQGLYFSLGGGAY